VKSRTQKRFNPLGDVELTIEPWRLILELRWLTMEPRTLTVESWKVFRPVVQIRNTLMRNRIRIDAKGRIRIRIKVKSLIWIRTKVKDRIRIHIKVKNRISIRIKVMPIGKTVKKTR
jgi:hypothetical protein